MVTTFNRATYEEKRKKTNRDDLEVKLFGNVEYKEHYIQTRDGEYICLTEIISKDYHRNTAPVLLCHGSFTNRRFWISPKGVGIAKYLRDAHFSVWIIDFRGHGKSPKSNNYNNNTTNQHWAYYDLPDAVKYIRQYTSHDKVSLVGHSLGGMTITSSLHYGWVKETDVEIAILVGTQYTHGKASLRDPLSRLIIRFFMIMYGYFPSETLGMGNEIESNIWMEQFLAYYIQRYEGRKLIEDIYWQFNAIKELKEPHREVLGPKIVNTKVVCITSSKDNVDPPEGAYQLFQQLATTKKKFIKLGKGETSNTDFTHPGMIVSKEAAKHVWPIISHYLLHHKMTEIN
eukprot:CAMPEP_0117420904 /NCGR_PEP_ID=MMETSP0758-20121206/2139_1 /TAXON_ID=63605 /ORGANISM="Percolomonas cosmopolitus, Strain AE-1 (ATCC 50343)" /LENGTH=342 /DNA_ID=CAMNT_0005202781 /DNA_START=33 /DNA_END=1058 /DNA_ORIENTATION=-